MNTVFCIQQKAHRNQGLPKKRKSICRCISLWSDKRKDAVFLHSKDKFFVVFAQKGQKRAFPYGALNEKNLFLPQHFAGQVYEGLRRRGKLPGGQSNAQRNGVGRV